MFSCASFSCTSARFSWSTTYGQFTSSPDWLMLSRVQFSEYDYDSSELRPHAPDRRDGGRRLRSLVAARGQIREEIGELDFPQHSGAASAKSCSAITALGQRRQP